MFTVTFENVHTRNKSEKFLRRKKTKIAKTGLISDHLAVKQG